MKRTACSCGRCLDKDIARSSLNLVIMLGIIAHMIVYVVKLATGVYMLPLAIILHASLTAGLIAFIEDNLKDEPESFW